ncbi:MAG: Hsp70 family protein, partial [Clostridiales bacterium]|nr:Hsp70 family protein [Clostridiales bacterium]
MPEHTRSSSTTPSGITVSSPGVPSSATFKRCSLMPMVINSLIDKTFECVQTVLDRNRLQYSNIRYFFTIGGSSRIQLISEKIQRLFQNCVFPPVDRQNCVALGAAKMLQAD